MKRCNCFASIIGITALSIMLCACQAEPQRQIFNVLSGKDRVPPVLLGVKAESSNIIVCSFNEPVYSTSQKPSFNADIEVVSITMHGKEMHLLLNKSIAPGTYVKISSNVKDAMGNTLRYSATCWGKNEDLPSLIINEFTTKGSGNNPDRVEILATSAGNIAGATFYDGIGDLYDSTFTFPSVQVEAGDFLVLYFGKDPPEQDSFGFLAGDVGLGSNNGVLTLYENPGGNLIDAVLYSNRTSESDTTFSGFGTAKVQQRVALLQSSGLWKSIQGAELKPESAIDSTYSTATRSMSRKLGSEDTDTKNDWHVVQTGKASFGFINASESHIP
jgi:hypothetical protein